MKFVCDRCQTKYSIADDRVRGKVLKVKCKTCGNVVTVREARHPSAAGLPTLATAGRVSTAPHASAAAALAIPPVADAADESERTQLAPNPMLLDGLGPPKAPAARRRSTGPMAPLGPPEDDVVWYMALDGKRTGPFSKHQLVDKLVPLAKNADVHIWNEKLGDWKPPSQVAVIASELAARKKVPPPPPLPGAPRRPTPPPIPPLAGIASAPAGQPRRPTPHASTVAPAVAAGAHAKLPPPGGAGVQRPGLFSAAVSPSAAPAEHGDPSSLLETPAPQPHMLHTPGTNGHPRTRKSSSDVLQMLNMPGSPQTNPGSPPRLMSLAPTVTWGAGVEAPAARNRNARLILVFLGVIAVICVVVVMGTMRQSKKSASSTTAASIATAPPPPAPEKVVEPPPPPPPIIEETPPPVQKGKGGKNRPGVKATPPSPRPGTVPPTPTPTPPPAGDGARFRDSRPNIPVSGGVASRPPPNQADITKVIANNRGNIKACYQRALLRDNTLTHGKIAVKLSIGISGRVKHISMDAPQQFRALEPCIKEVVQRWVFPQASEEYGTEFPLVFQGNE
jgi:predicted Zn finger-like uncharacterized protein